MAELDMVEGAGTRSSQVPLSRQLLLIALSLSALIASLLAVFREGPLQGVDLALTANLARIVLGMGAGFGLAVSGTVLDGAEGRPLRELSVLLASAGAAAGAGLLPVLTELGTVGFVAGGLGGAVLGLGVARLADGSARTHNLVAAALLLVALVAFVAATAVANADPGPRGRWLRWMMGDLSQASVLGGLIVCAVVGVLFHLLEASYRDLEVGADSARALGSNVAGPGTIAAVMWGLAVGAVGPVAMIGLLVPLATRRLLGPSQLRERLLFIGLAGAGALPAVDALQRGLIGGYAFALNIPITLLAFPFFLFWNAARLRETGRAPGKAYRVLESALIVVLTIGLLVAATQLVALIRAIS